MTTVQIYRNRRNPNKYLEIYNDGYYHNSVRQYMYWEKNILAGELLLNPVKNIVGDKKLYRWRKANLMELLEDYEVVAV